MSIAGEQRELLRFLTAGSVDDGKSTLIGRLLYESDGVYDDQLSSVRKASVARNGDLDLSLITDGLRAEREQGITIDVAYRYFSTKRRKFIIADAPGHEQYTRNMATGASTAQLAVILMDARKGVLQQTRRHALIAWLLGIRQMIVAVNKMDLVGFDEQAYSSIRSDFRSFSERLRGVQLHFVPLSALSGDNVIRSSDQMPWYRGDTLLGLLETLPAEPPAGQAFRFPVQSVIRPNQDFRGYAGQVASGFVKTGQEVVAFPSRQRTRIKEILLYDRSLHEAFPPQSVVLTTTDHIDLGRGDMLVAAGQAPTVSTKLTAYVIWLSHTPLQRGARYIIKHTTRILCGSFHRLNHKIDVNTMEPIEAVTLHFNEIGEVQLDLHNPIFCDPYEHHRATGSFIVIDPFNNDTVAAGLIVNAIPAPSGEVLDDVSGSSRLMPQHGLTVWFTGLSGAGKTTICRAVATELLAHGLPIEVIDGDVIRNHLCKDLGFSKRDRDENIRRIAFVSQLLTRNGTVVLVSAISPYRAGREEARRAIGDFLEVYVSTPLSVCEIRDPKLLYKKARLGEIHGFTGVDDPYEPPLAAEIVCDTDRESTRESSSKVVAAVLSYLSSKDS
ncbi:MAG: adenylyl-sulfate kinase [Candidatus Korobacteraceae bacterium]